MYLKKLFILAILVAISNSCSSSSGDSSSAYSNITISNSSVSGDNNYYSSHPVGSTTVSRCTWYDSGKYFGVNGYIVNNNVVEKLAGIKVSFPSKPTSSGAYTIGVSNTITNPNNLTEGHCCITIDVGLTTYKTLTLEEPVNVNVSNGVVTIDINNLTFSNNGSTSAIITGTIIEGK
jgi:hypothetical protein